MLALTISGGWVAFVLLVVAVALGVAIGRRF